MNDISKVNDFLDVANFIGKALHGIATGRDFTKQDAKDAVDAISAAAKLGTDYIIDNENDSRDIREFFNLISNVGKNGLD